jgi:L,D-transpeptidase-like protein
MLPPAAVIALVAVTPPPATKPATTVLEARGDRVVSLYAHPGGRPRFELLGRSDLGRSLILSVTRRSGRWAAVPTFLMPNGTRAWVRLDRRVFAVRRTTWRLRADLSARTLRVVHGHRLVRTLRVSIGAPGTPTPHGTFAVTDKLRGAAFGSAYGCCILALSGHQPRVPGGRLAIHGTDRPDLVGLPATEGCLRARNRDVRWLMGTVPVGTQLRIAA